MGACSRRHPQLMTDTTAMKQRVLDTHIHLASGWKEGQGGLPNAWLPHEPAGFQRDSWTEADIERLNAEAGGSFEIEGFIFVECSNTPAVEEARWVLDMAVSAESKIVGVVANIPVPKGAAAVSAFLAQLVVDGELPKALKGGRVVLLGDPMPAADACLATTYLEGLKHPVGIFWRMLISMVHPCCDIQAELDKAGLLWEWCCKPEAIPAISKACANFPSMTFVLDHLGHNSGGDDFETWAPALTELARNPNVVAKLGAIEQWEVVDPGPYLDHALKVFGADRVLAESNWFVSTAMGDPYDATFKHVLAACRRAGFTQSQIDAVFVDNAKKVYSL